MSEEEVKRGRGRPKGSTKKPQSAEPSASASTAMESPRGRGRPKKRGKDEADSSEATATTASSSSNGVNGAAPMDATTSNSHAPTERPSKREKSDGGMEDGKSGTAAVGSTFSGNVLPKGDDPFEYMSGFGNNFSSEALPGALPIGQNTPQRCAYGLFAEQLSGTSFTTPRVFNQKTWFYRIKPQCVHKPYQRIKNSLIVGDFSKSQVTPNQLRWKPFPLPKSTERKDFIDGLATLAGSGSIDTKTGLAIHIYAANESMKRRCFMNADGDFLFVPQQGALVLQTEMGFMRVKPGEIAVVQRGIKFRVELPDVKTQDDCARGYVLEVFNGHFRIPDLGPIGANGLANPRDFLHPVAAFEDSREKYHTCLKFIGEMWEAEFESSPFDVVAWHGNYVPYKYDLAHFVVVNSVSVDHLDPSIFTVLTCPTAEPGVACADFVIFPPRWCVQERTFRPPYYHRNCMSEFMGNIMGQYEAKPDGFMPGAGSLHSCMVGHGPDAQAYKKASDTSVPQEPMYLKGALAFMFESTYLFRLTDWALSIASVDDKYYKCWEGVQPEFDPTKK